MHILNSPVFRPATMVAAGVLTLTCAVAQDYGGGGDPGEYGMWTPQEGASYYIWTGENGTGSGNWDAEIGEDLYWTELGGNGEPATWLQSRDIAILNGGFVNGSSVPGAGPFVTIMAGPPARGNYPYFSIDALFVLSDGHVLTGDGTELTLKFIDTDVDSPRTLSVTEALTIRADGPSAISKPGVINFYDQAILESIHPTAINGSTINFNNSSILRGARTGSITGGTQRFYDNSMLDLSETVYSGFVQNYDGVIGGGEQFFYDSSILRIAEVIGSGSNYLNILNGGTQTFYENSRLETSVPLTFGGSTSNFHGESRLIAGARGSVGGGIQNFYDNSALETFDAGYDVDSSEYESEAFVASSQIRFYDESSFEANVADSTGDAFGHIQFYDDSTLNANVAGALAVTTLYIGNGGIQQFLHRSVLNANATGAIVGGEQTFGGSSRINLVAVDAIAGQARQYFEEDSRMSITAAQNTWGQGASFRDNAVLEAGALGGIGQRQHVLFRQQRAARDGGGRADRGHSGLPGHEPPGSAGLGCGAGRDAAVLRPERVERHAAFAPHDNVGFVF
jgi:hypothetical protein